MQALIRTVFPCYAAADRETAARLAAFMEAGAAVRVFLEEGEMRPGEDLAAKAREARMADIVLVLFSRNNLPPRWPRAEWEDALQKEPVEENVRIGFVRCDDCAPPRVLTPTFELGVRTTDGLRQLKRWIRNGEGRWTESARPDLAAEIELLGIAIADRPGTETVASADLAAEFALVFQDDFDAVLRLECGDRSPAALAGELAAQLGLRLEGDLESNLKRLGDFCSERRFLLLLLDAAGETAHTLAFGGRSSTLISAEKQIELADSDPLRSIQRQFRELDHTGDWAARCALARLGRRLTREQGRLAECFELMQQWHAAAETRSDRNVLDESAREMVWILEAWDRIDDARRLDYRRSIEFDDQMGLPFEGGGSV